MRRNSKTCLNCRHGDFARAAALISKTKNAMACRVAGFPENCTVRPIQTVCPSGLFQAADKETVKKRLNWIAAA